MDKTEFVSGSRPYSQEERDRDTAARRDADARAFARRRARRSGQHYQRPITPGLRRAYDRAVGSE